MFSAIAKEGLHDVEIWVRASIVDNNETYPLPWHDHWSIEENAGHKVRETLEESLDRGPGCIQGAIVLLAHLLFSLQAFCKMALVQLVQSKDFAHIHLGGWEITFVQLI